MNREILVVCFLVCVGVLVSSGCVSQEYKLEDCDRLTREMPFEDFSHCVTYIAKGKKDPSICEHIQEDPWVNTYDYPDCVTAVAEKAGEIGHCDLLKDYMPEDEMFRKDYYSDCVQMYILGTKDFSKCQYLEGEEKIICEAAGSGNTDICKSESVTYQSACVIQLVSYTDDKSLCDYYEDYFNSLNKHFDHHLCKYGW